MSGDNSLHWKDIFLQAMEESDKENLHRLVRAAELAIFLRREQLVDSAEFQEELSTMAVAIEALCSIRIHQIGAGKPRPSHEGGRRAESAESS
jgi:hypothetical protein